MFDERFGAESLDRYDLAFGQSETGSVATVGYVAENLASKLLQMRDKIDRAKELMCAQVFNTRVVEVSSGANIDYKAKAASLVDLNVSGDYYGEGNLDNKLFTRAPYEMQELEYRTKYKSLTCDHSAEPK